MENSRNFFKKEMRGIGILLTFLFLLLPGASHASSLRQIQQNVEQVQSIVPPVQFGMIGDSRDGERVYARLIQKILDRKPAFLIHLGDMISKPDEKEWQAFFEVSKPISVPFFPVAGNHDVGSTRKGREIYRKQFSLPEGETYYGFRSGGGLFVILDSEKGFGRISPDQMSWLENLLTSSKDQWKLVFIHRPLFLPEGSFKTGRAMDRHPDERDKLHRLFVKTEVKAVFEADDHRYDRRKKDGIVYVITGGGGAPIYSFNEHGGFFHYVWIRMGKEKMEGEAVDLEGQTQDRFIVE